jgi:serine/threonine protein kinase
MVTEQVLRIDSRDVRLDAMIGAQLPSASDRSAHYVIVERIGSGATATTFFAMLRAPHGETPALVKLLSPSFVRGAGPHAVISAHKEAAALSRLNEQVPPTPFVVRLIDTGWLAADLDGVAINLPWLATEYVHGGPAGTTLMQRLTSAMTETGYAFDSWRASRAIDCLGQGISAVHAVGVVHRDLKPENVLCCGAGADEIFKVADFGVARAEGPVATFGGGIFGTLGYAAPEQLLPDSQPISVKTDVFALGALVYFVLTGEDLFVVRSLADFLVQVQNPDRRTILDAARLHPQLRERETVCRAIDAAIADATAQDQQLRPHSGSVFSSTLLRLLQADGLTRRTTYQFAPPRETASVSWSWTWRFRPPEDFVVRHVAWDADGSCLFATNQGLAFWDGVRVRPAPSEGLPDVGSIRMIRLLSPGRWLLACDPATFAVYTTHGVGDVIQFSEAATPLDSLIGDLKDLAVAVGLTDEGPVLMTLCGGRWFRHVPLPEVARVTSLARVGDTEWLVGGHRRGGNAWAAVYSALDLEARQLETPAVRAIIAAAGDPDIAQGLLGGADGAVMWYERGAMHHECLPHSFDISAVAVDPSGGGWVAGAGRIAHRRDGRWEMLWEDDRVVVPPVSLFAHADRVVAMTADGYILEGTAARR